MLNLYRDRPYYVCTRLRMLEFLRNKGFLPIMTLPDIKNPAYYVWRFENTPELADAVEEYLQLQANRSK